MTQQDLITLITGDPMGQAEDMAKDASAYMSQYKAKKARIEEINKAIEAAQAAASRDRGKFGLGGSFLGGLLGVLGNVAFPTMGPVMQSVLQGILSGGSSYLAEDKRQEKFDATAGLKALKEKYKGRKEAKALDATINTIEQGLKDAKKSGAITSGLMGAAMPTNIGKGAKFDPTKAASSTNIPGPFSKPVAPVQGPAQFGLTDGIMSVHPDVLQTAFEVPELGGLSPWGATHVPALNVPSAMAGSSTSIQKSLLDKLIPIPGAADAIASLGKKPGGQAALAALRLGYAPVMQEIAPELVIDSYYEPEFRNPYKGGY